MTNSIAFVDTRVANYLELARTFDASVEVVFLDANKDGVVQIADRLEGRSGIEAVHIISHGAEASIQLGSSELSSSTLSTYEHLLSRIGSALSDDADILLYGCDVASGPDGRAFVEQVALLMGADVAASDDSTGSSILGGNAELEIRVGDIATTELIEQRLFDDLATDSLLSTKPSITPNPSSWSPLDIDPGTGVGDYSISNRGSAEIDYVVIHTTEGKVSRDNKLINFYVASVARRSSSRREMWPALDLAHAVLCR